MPKTTPLPYQKIGIFRMVNKFGGKCLLADDMGLGKSIQSLLAAEPYRAKRPIIVVCPNTVKWSWEDEVRLHTNHRCKVLEGRNPPKNFHKMILPPILILNWDILDAWCETLKKLKPRVIIADEIQFCKNKKTQRAKALRFLCAGVPCLYFLSGTPIENCPAEFYNTLNMLRPDIWKSWQKFAHTYCNPRVTPWGMDYTGSSNTKRLHKVLKRNVMVRRTSEEVQKDLPRLRRHIVPLDIPRKEYEEAEKDITAWIYKNKPDEVFRGKYMSSMIKFGYLLRLTSDLKSPMIKKWIDDFLASTNKKLVVFGYHRKFLTELQKHYKDNSVLVIGGVAGKKRKAAIDQFSTDKKTRLFFGSIVATGSGINKLIVASDVLMGELVYVPAKLLQAEKRIHRMGQTKPCNIHYLIARNTAEDSMCRKILKKQKNFNAVMNGQEMNKEFNVLKFVKSIGIR